MDQATPQAQATRPVEWQQWQAANPDFYPSPDAWRWFFRTHRRELIDRGAVTYIAGRVFVVPDRFEAAAVEIGTRMLAGLSRRAATAADVR